MIALVRHLIGWIIVAFQSREESDPRESCSATTAAGLTCEAAAPSFVSDAKTVLAGPEEGLGWMEEALDPGDAENGGRVAPSRLPAALEMALQSDTRGSEVCGQRDSCAYLPHGGRESDVGSAANPRRIAKTWLYDFRAHGLAMAPASAEWT